MTGSKREICLEKEHGTRVWQDLSAGPLRREADQDRWAGPWCNILSDKYSLTSSSTFIRGNA